MAGWEVALYAFVCGAMLTVSALGLESAMRAPSLDRWDRRFFTIFFASLTVGSAAFFPELVAYARPDLETLLRIAYFLESALWAVPFPMLAIYLLHCCDEDRRKSPLFRVMAIFWVIYFVLIIVSQFTTFFYYIGPNSQMHFGPAYPMVIGLVFVMLLLLAAGVVRRKGKLSRLHYRAFLICLLPIAVASLVHAFVPVFTLINVGLTISAYSMYRIIVADSVEQDKRRRQELADQRASIAVLQMRPHFIYNTMTTIYYLCDQDPQLAKQVTMDFTAYLRKNFAAVVSEDAVSFSEELEHTRAYLAVEQAQFDDGLVVSFDMPHTQFRVPPLTLQPIVENAVKHGMDPDSGPLHVWIRTRETDVGSEIIVEDDGSGFDPALAKEPHTTLANIRQRLDMICGGTLVIAPREGGGTVVRAMVPQRERSRKETQ